MTSTNFTGIVSLWLLAAVFAPSASAEEPAVDAKALANAEVLLDYCTKSDPTTAPEHRERVTAAVNGASEEALAKVRATPEYLKAQAAIVEFLAMVDEHNAKRVCTPRPKAPR